MLAEEWFDGIAPQLLSLLDGDGEPEMDRAAAFVIGFGILGRKQYGAPGMSLLSLDDSLTNCYRYFRMERIH